jgi:hypothetical protein
VIPEVEALEWDSAFFGFPIGRVDLDGTGADEVAAIDEQARALDLTCLYASMDPTDVTLAYAAQQQGYRLVEVAMDLEHPTNVPTDRRPTPSVARQGTPDDLDALADEITALAPWSRFATDPRFGLEQARRIQHAWVERAASGVDGRMLIVAEDGSGITGISSNRVVEGERPRVDLVASTKKGSGAAQALIAFSLDRFGPGGSWGGPIAARNRVSLRFCENIGYRVHSPRYLFHRWFDEP